MATDARDFTFSQLTAPPQSVAELYAPTGTPTGTADMTSPNAIFAPGPDDVAALRQAYSAPNPGPQPVYTGMGGYSEGGVPHPASTKRKIAAALLGLLAGPEAGHEALTAPYQTDLKNWAANEAQRQKKIEEAKALATTAADVENKQAQSQYYIAHAGAEAGQEQRAKAQAAKIAQVPDPVAIGKLIGMEPDSLSTVATLDDATKSAVSAALLKRFETGEKTTDMSFMTPTIADGLGITDPAHLATLENGLRHTSDANFGKILDLVKEKTKPTGEKAPAHITAIGPDGKSHIFGWDENTKKFSQDLGVAPPNYAQVIGPITELRQRTQTKTMFGPDGKPHDYSWNPETQKFDIDQGFSTAGQAGSREAQANIIGHAGNNLVQDIQAHKQDLGTLTAWYKQHTLDVPYIGDPKLAELDAELRSFAALQPAMHGFRSTNALQAFEKIIGGLAKNPDATIGSINGILKTAGVMGTTSVNPANVGIPRVGEVRKGYRFKGGDPSQQSSWEKQ